MLVCCEAFGRHVLEITADDRTFSVAKLFFAYGLGNALYFPFHVGAATVLSPERPEPARVFETITRERPTLFFAVPTAKNNVGRSRVMVSNTRAGSGRSGDSTVAAPTWNGK